MALDFLILYEHTVREYESDLLLKLELERRGYTVRIRQLLDAKDLRLFGKDKPEVLVASCMYDNEAINSHVYNNIGKCNKIVNLHWEQMLSDTQEEGDWFNMNGNAKRCVQTCWGQRTAQRLQAHGMDAKNTPVTGAVMMDFLRSEFKGYFKDKETLCKEFGLDPAKQLHLYISSFGYASMTDQEVAELSKMAGTDFSGFARTNRVSMEKTLAWFDRYLGDHPEVELVYRRHPSEWKCKALDELAVEDIRLGTVDHAVHLILVGCGEDLLGGDVGQEVHALFVLAAGAFPAGLFGQTHGQVGAVGALEADAFEVESVHLVPQGHQAVEMGLPLAHRVAAGHTADVKDELPQLFDGGIGVEFREHLLGPRGAGHGGDGPLDAVVHGVFPPRGHEVPVLRIHAADLAAVQPGVDLRVIGQQVQHTDAALALGVIQIAAQLVGLVVGQRVLTAQLHPGAGNGIVAPVHLHIPCTGLKAAAHTQAGQRGGLQRAADDHGLARLRVHAHPNDKVSVFFEQFIKVFHKRFLSAARNGMVVLP